MSIHPNDHRPVSRPTYPMTRRRSASGLVLGAIAIVAVLGLILWSMSDNDSTTATNRSDKNTGAATRTAPPNPPTPSATTPTQQ